MLGRPGGRHAERAGDGGLHRGSCGPTVLAIADEFLFNCRNEAMKPDSEAREIREMKMQLTDVRGVGPSTARALEALGIRTVAALAEASPKTVASAPGFGEARAADVVAAAAALLDTADTPQLAATSEAAPGAANAAAAAPSEEKPKAKKIKTKDEKKKKKQKKGKKKKKSKKKKNKKK